LELQSLIQSWLFSSFGLFGPWLFSSLGLFEFWPVRVLARSSFGLSGFYMGTMISEKPVSAPRIEPEDQLFRITPERPGT
jgi:hypothetical protein